MSKIIRHTAVAEVPPPPKKLTRCGVSNAMARKNSGPETKARHTKAQIDTPVYHCEATGCGKPIYVGDTRRVIVLIDQPRNSNKEA